jgi:hypothetical protein
LPKGDSGTPIDPLQADSDRGCPIEQGRPTD